MIKYVKAKNVQNINDIEISFQKGDVNILIGESGTGKSNLLKTINMIKELLEAKKITLYPYKFNETSDNNSYIKIILLLNTNEYEYEVSYSIEDRTFSKETLTISSGTTTISINREDFILDSQKSMSIKYSHNEYIKNFANFFTGNFYFLDSNKNNIKELLLNIKKTSRDTIFDIISRKLQSLFLGIESIDITNSYGREEIVLGHLDISTLFSFDLESDGIKKIIFIIYVLFVLKPDVLLLDEPENNIHPVIIKKLLQEFINSGKQIIFATHSIELLELETLNKSSSKIFFVEKINGSLQISEQRVYGENIRGDLYYNYFLEIWRRFQPQFD